MKNMNDIRAMSDADLAQAVVDGRETLRARRFAATGSAAGNTREARAHRIEIARMLTELTKRARI